MAKRVTLRELAHAYADPEKTMGEIRQDILKDPACSGAAEKSDLYSIFRREDLPYLRSRGQGAGGKRADNSTISKAKRLASPEKTAVDLARELGADVSYVRTILNNYQLPFKRMRRAYRRSEIEGETRPSTEDPSDPKTYFIWLTDDTEKTQAVYVGKTIKPMAKRLAQHEMLDLAKTNGLRFNCRITGFYKTEDAMNIAEQILIAKCRADYGDLCKNKIRLLRTFIREDSPV